MKEEQSQVVHDFLYRQAGQRTYNLARLKAYTELAKLHREEFLKLSHKYQDTLISNSTMAAEQRFQALSDTDVDHLYVQIQRMKERTKERRKARTTK